MQNSHLQNLVKDFYDRQERRISRANRLGLRANMTTFRDESDERMYKMLKEDMRQEEELKALIDKELDNFEIWTEYLIDVKGCGSLMSAVIISQFNITLANTVSSFWAYAGLAPESRKMGNYNHFLKTKLLGVLATSFLMKDSPYKKFYEDYKHRKLNDGLTKSHAHNLAKRYMMKMFIKDLWMTWRKLEGLSTRTCYQEQYLGHVHK